MIKEMDGFNLDITNTVIDELIPLPPCLGNNFLGEFDSLSEQYPNIHEEFVFDESISHAILAFHKLESTNGSLRIDGVTSSSTDCVDDDNVDYKCFSRHQESKLEMRNENAFSQLYQTNVNNLNLKQSLTLFDHNRNPNIRKRSDDVDAECPKSTLVACDSSHKPKTFEIVFDNTYRSKKRKLHSSVSSTCISFDNKSNSSWELDEEAIAEVKEMVYMKAALRPINLEVEKPVEKPKRKNVRVSSDPQTVAARHRREKISDKLRVLQRLVPGGSKLDTASMLDEAASYVKFLQSLVRSLENMDPTISSMISVIANPVDTMLSLPQMKP